MRLVSKIDCNIGVVPIWLLCQYRIDLDYRSMSHRFLSFLSDIVRRTRLSSSTHHYTVFIRYRLSTVRYRNRTCQVFIYRKRFSLSDIISNSEYRSIPITSQRRRSVGYRNRVRHDTDINRVLCETDVRRVRYDNIRVRYDTDNNRVRYDTDKNRFQYDTEIWIEFDTTPINKEANRDVRSLSTFDSRKLFVQRLRKTGMLVADGRRNTFYRRYIEATYVEVLYLVYILIDLFLCFL